MNIDFVTKQDFEILDEKISRLLEVLEQKKNQEPSTDWIKSVDVKRYLGCSDSSLTNYRNKGVLPYTKIGGTYYYSRKAVNAVMNSGK